jgi:hypothetical protein
MHLDKEMLKAYRAFESLEDNLTQEDIWEVICPFYHCISDISKSNSKCELGLKNQVLYKQAINGDNTTPQPREQDVQVLPHIYFLYTSTV